MDFVKKLNEALEEGEKGEKTVKCNMRERSQRL